MTDQEKQELFDELLQQIKSESQDIAALEEVSSLTGVKSLPAMRGTQLVTAPISLLSQAAMEGASLTLDLAELDAITSALKAERAYGKPALCGFIKQGDITIGTFACYASGGNTGYVQRLMSNYIINADGTITGSEIATSGRQQTHIAERVYRGGAWTLWREIASANEASDKYYKPTRIEKIADYAYHIWYGGVDYADAAEYFKGNYEAAVGACSAIWKDGILYRNYDWYYSNNAGFFVHTPAVNGRHAVNGFAGYLKGLTMAVVDSGEWNDKYRILPYLMTDGMNDAGLSAAVLVCENKDVTPTAQNTGKKKMNGLFVVRYVLDNHTDALEAAQDIANNYDVYMPHTDNVDEELHFIIGDKEKCVILEFVDNETKIITDRNFVTNFKLYNTLSNADGTIKYNTVHPYGQGVERYNQIARIYDMAPGVSLLATLKYTNAYQGDIEGAWRTEFTGINDNLTVLAAFVEPERYSQILAAARTAFLARTRSEEKTWQTCHSVIFDSNTKKINFFVQEDNHHVWTYDTTSPGLEDEIAAREAADAALWAAVNNAATKDDAKGVGVSASQYTAKRINLAGENVLLQLNTLLNGIGATTELNQELNGILAIGIGGFTMSVHNIQLNADSQKYIQIAVTPLGISDDGQSLTWPDDNTKTYVLVRRRDSNGWQPWKPLHQEIIGNLGNLTTPKKSDLVSAINCVYETVVITADLLWAATSTGLPSPKSIPVQQIYEVASAAGNRGKMVKVVANDNSGRYITCMVNLIAKPNEYNIFAFVPYSDTPVIYKLHYAPGFPTRSYEVINLANSVNKVNLSDSTPTDRWTNMTAAEFDEVIEKSGINYDTLYPVVVTWKSQNKVYIVQSILTANTSVVRLLDINTMEMYDYALDSKTQTVAKTYVNRMANLSDVSSYIQKREGAIIGDVSTLNTTEKLVVPAINEVLDKCGVNKIMLSDYTGDADGWPVMTTTEFTSITGGIMSSTKMQKVGYPIVIAGIPSGNNFYRMYMPSYKNIGGSPYITLSELHSGKCKVYHIEDEDVVSVSGDDIYKSSNSVLSTLLSGLTNNVPDDEQPCGYSRSNLSSSISDLYSLIISYTAADGSNHINAGQTADIDITQNIPGYNPQYLTINSNLPIASGISSSGKLQVMSEESGKLLKIQLEYHDPGQNLHFKSNVLSLNVSIPSPPNVSLNVKIIDADVDGGIIYGIFSGHYFVPSSLNTVELSFHLNDGRTSSIIAQLTSRYVGMNGFIARYESSFTYPINKNLFSNVASITVKINYLGKFFSKTIDVNNNEITTE